MVAVETSKENDNSKLQSEYLPMYFSNSVFSESKCLQLDFFFVWFLLDLNIWKKIIICLFYFIFIKVF